MQKDERNKLKQKLVEKNIVPEGILDDYNELKDSLNRYLGELDQKKDTEMKKAFSTLKKKAQKKY